MDSLSTPEVSRVLARIYSEADSTDPAVFDHIIAEIERTGGPKSAQYWAKELDKAYMPVAPEVGRLLYILTRTRRPRLVVEFGTSFGISAIHLASALRDNGAGRLVATELNPIKAARARENLRSTGLADLVELREGDALQTLTQGFEGGIDMVLLDGWKEIYLPVLQLLEPHLNPGALVIADDTTVYPESVTPYLEYVRKEGNGYLSVAVPLDDGLELSFVTSAGRVQ
ncbi:O-methyltransferase [Sorangium cellulosum]|uniref:Methyltransferase n=1 Tax=Sorangium cellulosum TaxID=56 RepID=A0A150QUK6_SORCE|nr:O-methyltransferase [Sorangium cellulosum]KYF71661.1 methyltransferase [Sorangium cellulosum]